MDLTLDPNVQQKCNPTNLMKTTYIDPILICLVVCSLISTIPHSSFILKTCIYSVFKLYFHCVSEQSHWSGVCLRSWLMHLSSSDLKELSAHSPANDDCFSSLLRQKPLLEYQIISVRFVDCIHAWLCLIFSSFSPRIASPLPLSSHSSSLSHSLKQLD